MPPRKTPPSIIAAKTLVHALVLTPLAILAWQFWDVYSTNSDALGADPVAEIEHRLGLWALRFLMLALAITPLRSEERRAGNECCSTCSSRGWPYHEKKK